ncbi:MAG: YdcF family protein [Bacteroidia bacterium]|nr:YdcF family protein [Bacteroidia bacterium]
MKRKRRLLLVFVVLTGMLTAGMIYFSYRLVESASYGYIYTDLNKIPPRSAGLLLGTSRYLSSGRQNPFFRQRIQAAKALYFSGKVRYLILSGDNRFFSYNEPREMRRDLLRMGIPDSVIFMDFAGFRTLDSVVRCKKVFKLKKILIISQAFHVKRAVCIARHHHMDAIAYIAKDPPRDFQLMVLFREYFARVAMVLDLYLFDRDPYFLGDEQLPAGAYQ